MVVWLVFFILINTFFSSDLIWMYRGLFWLLYSGLYNFCYALWPFILLSIHKKNNENMWLAGTHLLKYHSLKIELWCLYISSCEMNCRAYIMAWLWWCDTPLTPKKKVNQVIFCFIYISIYTYVRLRSTVCEAIHKVIYGKDWCVA